MILSVMTRPASGRLDEGQDFLRNSGIVADIDALGEPASPPNAR
jgi:hypothetical protein